MRDPTRRWRPADEHAVNLWRTSTMSRVTMGADGPRTEERDTPRSVHSWDFRWATHHRDADPW